VQYTSSVTKSYISSPNYCTPPVAPPPSGASYIEPALYTGQGVAVNADGINGGGSYSFSGLDQESCAWNWAGQGTAPANLEVGVAPSALIEVMTPGGFSGSPVCQHSLRHLTTLNHDFTGRGNDSLLYDFSEWFRSLSS